MINLSHRDTHMVPHIIEAFPMSEEGKEKIRGIYGVEKPKPPEPATDLSWLTYNFQRPLPSLIELEKACHFLGCVWRPARPPPSRAHTSDSLIRRPRTM